MTGTSSAHHVTAHPLRARILHLARAAGRITSTEAAQQLGTNTGVTSYHLRVLAQAGAVIEAGHDGRKRWWSAAPDSDLASLGHTESDEDDADATRWLSRDYVLHHAERSLAWIDAQESWPTPWVEACQGEDHLLVLTAEQLAEARQEIMQVLQRHARRGAGNPQAKRVTVALQVHPVDQANPPRPRT